MISPALVVSAAEHVAEGEQGAGAAESASTKQRRGAEEMRTLDAGAEHPRSISDVASHLAALNSHDSEAMAIKTATNTLLEGKQG